MKEEIQRRAPVAESRLGPDWLLEIIGVDEIHAHRVQRVVAEVLVGQASISVLQTPYGRALVKNGRLQSTELDEWVYHEALVHPAMIAHSKPRCVLCIGGTTGAIIREILKHSSVEEVLVFGVDRQILDALDGHLPYAERAIFADPRVKGVYPGALDPAILGHRQFDVVVADPPESSEAGFSEKDVYTHLFASVAKTMSGNSVLAIAGGAVHPVAESSSTLPHAFAIARKHFNQVKLGIAPASSLGIPWGMLFCSQKLNVTDMDAASVNRRLAQRGVSGLRFYDGETHIGMYSAPKHVRAWLPPE
jgi:spermidine synthase